MIRVFTAGYRCEDDEKSEQVRFGAVIRNVCSTYRSRTNRQAIPIGKGIGVTHCVRVVIEQSQNQLRF